MVATIVESREIETANNIYRLNNLCPSKLTIKY